MNPVSVLVGWGRNARAAKKLRRQARDTADPGRRAELLLEAAKLADVPSAYMEAAVALAEARRYDECAASWRRAIQLKPVLIPGETQVAALEPVLPQVAREVLDGLSRGPGLLEHHWKLQRRGAFDGEERWKLEQEAHETMSDLLPTLRYIALAVAHTAGAPGRVRIDIDRMERDSETNLMGQMGEAIFTLDDACRIIDVRIHE
ncbi:MAG TPA: hypothetical protein VFS20_22520 [Longimicrobium sp.]|nr:hypothetical protein [Longimicrobium sp.]